MAPARDALELYEAAVQARGRCTVEWADGTMGRLPVERWLGAPTPAELELLARAPGPVLDVGCGPGRLAEALNRRRVPVLGVDVASAAIRIGRSRGVPVVEGSVFGSLPGRGWWASALLIDGNIGIGGDPVALLVRLGELLRPAGRVLAEVEPPGAPTVRTRLRLRSEVGPSQWVPWARVGVDGVETLAGAAGWAVQELWSRGPRWFAELRVGAQSAMVGR